MRNGICRESGCSESGEGRGCGLSAPLGAECSLQRKTQRRAGQQVSFQSGHEGTLTGEDPGEGRRNAGKCWDWTHVPGPGQPALREPWGEGQEDPR